VPGGYDMYSRYQGTAQSATVTGLPTHGGVIWVRLWSLIDGSWQFVDRSFPAANDGGIACVTSPAPGSILTPVTTFQWSAGAGASYYWLDVGTSRGGYDVSSGYAGTGLSKTVSGIPATGATIWVRLYSRVGGEWQFVDTSFRAPGS
jgi:hypothetical protein